MTECCLDDWRRYQRAVKKLSRFPNTCNKGTIRLATVTRGKNFENNGTQKWELKVQSSAARYVDLSGHVAAGNSKTLEFSSWGKIKV